jgi:hypothetical protein
MASERKTMDADRLTALLKDPIVIKIVTILDVVSLSVLELLEYGISRKDVSKSLANEIIEFDKSVLVYYFYNFLNSKVKLTELGLYILETIKGEQFNKTNVPSYGTTGLQPHTSLEDIHS